MKKALLVFSSLIIFLTIAGCGTSTNVIGKIYPKADADSLFGPVEHSVKLNTEMLKSMLAADTTDYAMFKVFQDSVVILNKHRSLIYPKVLSKRMAIQDTTVLRAWSKSMIQQLINDGSAADTYIEVRPKAMTITNQNSTLEESDPCPPFCW